MKRLIEIQQKLKAPKGQTNSFGGYKYRSCEDILEAIKPLLAENNLLILLNDEIEYREGRFYVKATATLLDAEGKQIAQTSAFAREEESKPKMDGSQVTGSASSYARKYALNGLFAIDDTKDADATNTHGKEPDKPLKKEPEKVNVETIITWVENAASVDYINKLWVNYNKKVNDVEKLKAACAKRKAELIGETK